MGGMGRLVSDNGELDTPPAGAGLLWTSGTAVKAPGLCALLGAAAGTAGTHRIT